MLHIHLTADAYPLHSRCGVTVQEIATDGSKETLYMSAIVIPGATEGLWDIHWSEWTQGILKEAMLAISRNSATEE